MREQENYESIIKCFNTGTAAGDIGFFLCHLTFQDMQALSYDCSFKEDEANAHYSKKCLLY